MEQSTPRIRSVTVPAAGVAVLIWASGHRKSDRVELAGWIATGGDVLAPLKDAAVFRTAKVGEHGRAVYWGDEDGDLAIDAVHLQMLAEEQRPFGNGELVAWQTDMHLSNNESADFLGVSLSTFNAYKAGANIPAAVGMLCRAARRDPILMQAHYRPRKAGRPRSEAPERAP